MFCTNCGNPLPDDAKFCPSCGTQVTQLLTTCSQCGAQRDSDARFCAECGNEHGGASQSRPADVLPRLLADHNSVTPAESVSCLINILQDEELSWDAYGEAEALAQRIVWTFPDDEETVVWITREGGIYLSQLGAEFEKKSPWPWPDLSQFADECEFNEDTNGWKYSGNAPIMELLEHFGASLGEPLMILPWESTATKIADQDFEEFASNYFAEFEEDDDVAARAEALYTFYCQVADFSLELPDEGGEFGYDYGDGFMPRYSKVGRFNAFLGDLEANYGWGIVYDECCGTCLTGTLEDRRQEEGMQDASFFITWAQNANSGWGTSGWVHHMAYHPDETEREAIMNVAASHGLTVTEGEENGEKDGFLYLS